MASKTVPSMYNRYFMYSASDAARATRVYGKNTECGTVIVRGVPKPYTSIVTDPSSSATDAVVVTQGDIRKIKYTEPTR
jgi:hypothetical protein